MRWARVWKPSRSATSNCACCAPRARRRPPAGSDPAHSRHGRAAFDFLPLVNTNTVTGRLYIYDTRGRLYIYDTRGVVLRPSTAHAGRGASALCGCQPPGAVLVGVAAGCSGAPLAPHYCNAPRPQSAFGRSELLGLSVSAASLGQVRRQCPLRSVVRHSSATPEEHRQLPLSGDLVPSHLVSSALHHWHARADLVVSASGALRWAHQSGSRP